MALSNISPAWSSFLPVLIIGHPVSCRVIRSLVVLFKTGIINSYQVSVVLFASDPEA